ncbi:MAG: hypothetical protein U0228_33570 [Myxococcaceae bacterium]
MRAFFFVVAVALSSLSCGTPPCGPSTCPIGCCDAKGVCQGGTTTAACGLAGGTCNVCQFTQQCLQGTCFSGTAGGTGGGTGGGGGGTTGGGGGTTGGGGGGTTGGGGATGGGGSATGGGSAAVTVFPRTAVVPEGSFLTLSASYQNDPRNPALVFSLEPGSSGYFSTTSPGTALFVATSGNATARVRVQPSGMSALANFIDLSISTVALPFDVGPRQASSAPMFFSPATRQTFGAARAVSSDARGVAFVEWTMWPSLTPSTNGTFTLATPDFRVYARDRDSNVYASGEFQVGTTSLPSVEISPTVSTVAPNGVVQLTATTSTGVGVSWNVMGLSSNGTVSQSGTYTAPPTPGVYVVRALALDGSGQRFAVATLVVQ